jgi:hypothetical protein
MEQPKASAQRQIDDFARRIMVLQQQHQQIAYALCVERLARDIGLLPARPTLRSWYAERIEGWLSFWRHRAPSACPGVAYEQGRGVIIIDADPHPRTAEDVHDV